jgi:hypothetical protein
MDALSKLPVIEAYNEHGEFYVIDGVCPYYADKSWMENMIAEGHDYKEMVSIVKAKTHIQYNAIILGSSSLDDIYETIESIKQLNCETNKLIIQTFLNENQLRELRDFLQEQNFALWQIENQLFEEKNDALIRRTINHHKNHWHLFLEAGEAVRQDFINACTDRFFFNQEDPCFYMKDKSGPAKIVSGKLFMMLDHQLPEEEPESV